VPRVFYLRGGGGFTEWLRFNFRFNYLTNPPRQFCSHKKFRKIATPPVEGN